MTWPGCHGVALEGEDLAIGRVDGDPIASAYVRFGDVDAPRGERLWTQHGETIVDGERVVVDRAMFAEGDDRYMLAGTHGPPIVVDRTTGTITIGEGDDATRRQLVAAFALPLMLHSTDTLLVHGSSCERDGEAVLVCGVSGAGKSSVLIGLVDDGWAPVSEDVCAIDTRSGDAMVWPGPPWVRLARGERGPAGCAPMFASADKTAWDLSGVVATAPTRVTRVIVLDPPGGDAPQREVLSSAEALRAVAPHAVWLEHQDARARRLFAPMLSFLSRVPTQRLRLPRRDDWRGAVPDAIALTTLAS